MIKPNQYFSLFVHIYVYNYLYIYICLWLDKQSVIVSTFLIDKLKLTEKFHQREFLQNTYFDPQAELVAGSSCVSQPNFAGQSACIIDKEDRPRLQLLSRAR